MTLPKNALRIFFASFLSFLFLPFLFTGLASAQSSPEVTIYLFWGDGCPHCAVAKPYLERLAASNPGIHLLKYEVYNDEDNLALLKKFPRDLVLRQQKCQPFLSVTNIGKAILMQSRKIYKKW